MILRTWLGTTWCLWLGLVACGTATAGPEELAFEVRRVEVGYPSAGILVLDVTGDGMTDILVSGDGHLTVLEGDGTGDFTVQAVLEAGEHPVDLAAGDVDGDGFMDVAVANHETGYVTLLFGRDGGLDPERRRRLEVDVSPHPHAVALADFDGDGHVDLLVDDRDRERFVHLAGVGDGTFESATPVEVGGDPYRGLSLADVNGDGHLDVVTPNPRSVAVQLGDGQGGFAGGPELPSAAMPPFRVAVADLDGDGHPDVAAGSGEGAGGVTIWWGDAEGGFLRDPGSPHAIAQGPTALATADLDGDGREDLAVTSYVGGEIAVIHGGRTPTVVRVPLGGNPWNLGAGDLNGDGRTDLAVADDGRSAIIVLLRQPQGNP